jgi:methylmalonyl-CoA epimerase
VFEMTRIDHIGIATDSIADATTFWEMLGFNVMKDEVVEDQGVKIRYLNCDSETRIELLEPLSEESPVGRFITNRGAGVQQVAISVEDLEEAISSLIDNGIRMINNEPVIGSGGHKIAFVHPSSSGGVLVELVEDN